MLGQRVVLRAKEHFFSPVFEIDSLAFFSYLVLGISGYVSPFSHLIPCLLIEHIKLLSFSVWVTTFELS